MNKEVCFIGLDISTSIIGICLINNNQEIVSLSAINLKKTKNIFDKSVIVRDYILKLRDLHIFSKNCSIAIEEAFQSFRKGFSSAKTLSQLNKFNGIVSYLVYDIFNIEPVYINVNSARKNLQIKIDKSLEKNTKQQVFDWVRNQIKYDWPTKKLKSGPNKGLVKFDESCYDMSDSYVICKALIFNENNNT